MEFLKEKLNLRLYQETILNTVSQKDTLVVLPTGLGKTHIAVALASLRLPLGKILFLAPTKPLIAQHLKTFSEYFSPTEKLAVFSGEVDPEKRNELWQKSQIIFSTPQTVKNDLLVRRIDFHDVALIVFDEAHRAVGNYAYSFLANEYIRQANTPKILALTASPGTDEAKINEICKNLFIEKIELRSKEDSDVKAYVKQTVVSYQLVDLPEEIKNIKLHLETAIKLRLDELKKLGFITNSEARLTKKALIALQLNLRAKVTQQKIDFSLAQGLSTCAALLKLRHAHALAESESLAALNKYFEELWKQASDTKIRAVKNIVNDFYVRAAYSLTTSAIEKNIENPKLFTLQNIVKKQIEISPKSKILVFTEFRANIPKILQVLGEISGANVHKFVGQSSKKDEGMNQKTQIDIINRLKGGDLNCLVCTSVAEEGLDIPQVDLVVFYSPIPSAIRSIQRRGRTGRQAAGKLAILVAKGTKDEAYYWIAKHKETRMAEVLSNFEIKKLDTFIDKTEKQTKNDIIIFADSREQGNIVDQLYLQGINVKVGQLKVGDFILSEDVCVERKIVEDFVNSLLDGRLFEQAKNLKSNFSLPLYLIEGNLEDMFKTRNVAPQALWSALASLVLDWKIPILFSSSPKETAEILATVAKREQIEKKKEVSIRGEHKPKTFAEQQQFFVEGFPMIGPTAAKELLKKFGNPKNIANASMDELQNVEGIGKKKAELIRKLLDSNYSFEL